MTTGACLNSSRRRVVAVTAAVAETDLPTTCGVHDCADDVRE